MYKKHTVESFVETFDSLCQHYLKMESKSRVGKSMTPELADLDAQNDNSSTLSTSTRVLEECGNEKKSKTSTCSVKAVSSSDCQTQTGTSASSASLRDSSTVKHSVTNSAIGRMTKEQLQEKLAELKLSTSGMKDVLKKRLKDYYKRQNVAHINRKLTENEKTKYDYLVVIDFEATCNENNDEFVHEIIEFPAVLVDIQSQTVCNVFQSFCKPTVNPILTEFCTNLTGISQAQVDTAKDFSEVFKDFEDWLSLHKLGTKYKFAVVTDGPWDMAKFLKTQMELSDMTFPRWAKQWINLRKSYAKFYGCDRTNLHRMLDELGLTFQGRPHCGLDDARNIAAIVVKLLQDGCVMKVNEHYHGGGTGSQKRNGPSRASGHSHCNKSSGKLHSSKKTDSRDHKPIEAGVQQDGENIEDLLRYLKIQKS